MNLFQHSLGIIVPHGYKYCALSNMVSTLRLDYGIVVSVIITPTGSINNTKVFVMDKPVDDLALRCIEAKCQGSIREKNPDSFVRKFVGLHAMHLIYSNPRHWGFRYCGGKNMI